MCLHFLMFSPQITSGIGVFISLHRASWSAKILPLQPCSLLVSQFCFLHVRRLPCCCMIAAFAAAAALSSSPVSACLHSWLPPSLPLQAEKARAAFHVAFCHFLWFGTKLNGFCDGQGGYCDVPIPPKGKGLAGIAVNKKLVPRAGSSPSKPQISEMVVSYELCLCCLGSKPVWSVATILETPFLKEFVGIAQTCPAWRLLLIASTLSAHVGEYVCLLACLLVWLVRVGLGWFCLFTCRMIFYLYAFICCQQIRR